MIKVMVPADRRVRVEGEPVSQWVKVEPHAGRVYPLWPAGMCNLSSGVVIERTGGPDQLGHENMVDVAIYGGIQVQVGDIFVHKFPEGQWLEVAPGVVVQRHVGRIL